MKIGDVYEKINSSGFRPSGHKVKIVELSRAIVGIQHLPITDGMLGDDIGHYGVEMFLEDYKKCNPQPVTNS